MLLLLLLLHFLRIQVADVPLYVLLLRQHHQLPANELKLLLFVAFRAFLVNLGESYHNLMFTDACSILLAYYPWSASTLTLENSHLKVFSIFMRKQQTVNQDA